MRWWKIVGLAGLVGVVATGVVIVQAERHRRAYTPEQIRARLRVRLAEASERSSGPDHRRPAQGHRRTRGI